MLSFHLCFLIPCDSLVFRILSFDCSFCLIAWYLYIFTFLINHYVMVLPVMEINKISTFQNFELVVHYFAHKSIFSPFLLMTLTKFPSPNYFACMNVFSKVGSTCVQLTFHTSILADNIGALSF